MRCRRPAWSLLGFARACLASAADNFAVEQLFSAYVAGPAVESSFNNAKNRRQTSERP